MSSRVFAQKPDTSLFGAIFLFVFATHAAGKNGPTLEAVYSELHHALLVFNYSCFMFHTDRSSGRQEGAVGGIQFNSPQSASLVTTTE